MNFFQPDNNVDDTKDSYDDVYDDIYDDDADSNYLPDESHDCCAHHYLQKLL